MHIDTRVIEVAGIKSEFKFDLWGCGGHLEATMASEATEMAVRGNMHIDTRVIEVADFKTEVKFDFWGQGGTFIILYVFKKAVVGNMIFINEDIKFISDLNRPLQHLLSIIHGPCRRRS